MHILLPEKVKYVFTVMIKKRTKYVFASISNITMYKNKAYIFNAAT